MLISIVCDNFFSDSDLLLLILSTLLSVTFLVLFCVKHELNKISRIEIILNNEIIKNYISLPDENFNVASITGGHG